MAFHQQTRQATQRLFRPEAGEDETRTTPATQPVTQRPVEDSQTWVLFAPPTEAATSSGSYISATHDSKSTPGRSQISDVGSINTAGRSYGSAGQQHQSISIIGTLEGQEEEQEQEDEEDDAELDSLDSHLSEFRAPPALFSNVAPTESQVDPMLPAHDGLGSFRLDQHEGMGTDAQDRLYTFEQYNPRRVKRRRESLEIGQAALEDHSEEADKMRRIEQWRLEHSRYLLNEIRKETRRRRRPGLSTTLSSTSSSKSRNGASSLHSGDRKAEARASSMNSEMDIDKVDQDNSWHDQQPEMELEGDQESIWDRITRKLLRDLLGIDDKMLSILFGESLPDEDGKDDDGLPKAGDNTADTIMKDADISSWHHILERIAKELGLFVHQMSEHPGAFSTFARVQQTPLPYAGLPPIPEVAKSNIKTSGHSDEETALPPFKPTIPPPSAAEKPPPRHLSSPGPISTHASTNTNPGLFTQDEWEQDLDVRLVFRYLRSRFLPRLTGTPPTTNGPAIGIGSGVATSSSPELMAAKAARVRQHHPLISRTRPNRPPSNPAHYHHFRHPSSCTSHSTRRSVRRSSCSSRHYWDFGGSAVGTGSIIAAAGPMGSWGEI